METKEMVKTVGATNKILDNAIEAMDKAIAEIDRLRAINADLLEACEKMKGMADEILKETNFISIEACRDYVKEFLEYCGLQQTIKKAKGE